MVGDWADEAGTVQIKCKWAPNKSFLRMEYEVKRKGAEHPTVLPCTLLAYDPQFELGHTLADAARAVPLNHPYCASFCVLGGAACSR